MLIPITKSKKITLFDITSYDKKIGDMLFVKK